MPVITGPWDWARADPWQDEGDDDWDDGPDTLHLGLDGRHGTLAVWCIAWPGGAGLHMRPIPHADPDLTLDLTEIWPDDARLA